MYTLRPSSFASLLALSAVGHSMPAACGSGAGDLVLNNFQLYPENADYDPASDLAFFSVLYNASVAVYNPSSNSFEDNINFPQTMEPVFHASGIDVDAANRKLSVLVNAGVAFDTEGANVTGDNFLYKVDLSSPERQVLWGTNLSAVTNGAYGGCQDAASDAAGNTYAVCTYPSAIIKVTPDGTQATPWYLSNYTAPGASPIEAGLSGIVPIGDFLVGTESRGRRLLRFDTKAAAPEPVEIPISGYNASVWGSSDGAFMPPKYDGKVLLVSDNTQGTTVLVSTDGWQSAKQVGFIPKMSEEAFSVASMQLRGRVYAVNEFFADAANPKVPGTNAGPRAQFPLQDINKQVYSLVKSYVN
ncbi:hypothetical protein NLG97_g6194 [Lecanicillium saksenae]|uniref:Uncharacterized protein n=1 Tax=Lecanicillium saksenae TaxID=468837 RepID=A0ACC1QTI8_9HYPO|nr:hypothetical protein NLG97_g6194 [Lecanicillium saksenae]